MFSCKESSGSFVFWRYQWIEVNTTPDQHLIQLDWQLSKITRIHCRFSTSTDVNLIKETNCTFWTLHFIVKKKYSLPQNFSKTTCVGRSDFNSRQASVENDVKLQFPITSGCGFFFVFSLSPSVTTPKWRQPESRAERWLAVSVSCWRSAWAGNTMSPVTHSRADHSTFPLIAHTDYQR